MNLVNSWTVVSHGAPDDKVHGQNIFKTSFQNPNHQDKILADFGKLKVYGPELPRPYADTIKGSRYKNMKELRVQHTGHPIRAFYAFDPIRRAIILCAGETVLRQAGAYR